MPSILCDRDRLPDVLRQQRFDWITITSPEAATVFRDAWLAAGQPAVQIAAVGAGTGKALNSMEPSGLLDPAFTPTTVRHKAVLHDCLLYYSTKNEDVASL